jgi:hypothetical protein
MNLLRGALLALICWSLIGIIIALWLGSLDTAKLFTGAAIAAFATLCLAEWFDAQLDAYGRDSGLTTNERDDG